MKPESNAPPPPPVFRATGRVWRVDSCRPQVEAMLAGKIEYHALSNGAYPGAALPKGALPGAACVGFWDAIGPQDWGLDLHRNEGVEIALMETGGMPFILEGGRHDLRAGDLTVTRPWQLHGHGHPLIGPGRLHWAILDVGVRRPNEEWRWPAWVVLSADDRSELAARLRRNGRPVLKASEALQEDFRAIARVLQERPAAACLSPVAVHLNALLYHLLEALRAERNPPGGGGNPAEQTVALFLADLERNPGHLSEDWTLESMAAECGLKPTAFAKYCRLLKNTSPLRHLNRLRLQAAADLLRARPSLTITEVAFRAGFHSSQYFATQFQRHYHLTPKAFREKWGRKNGGGGKGSADVRSP